MNKKKAEKRKRNIIWYNPHIVYNAKTNIEKLFSKSHPYSKIFNKYSIKLSYSSTRNDAAIITSYNQNLCIENFGCNCRNN